MPIDETNHIKIKDIFDTPPLLTGRTETETITKDKGLVWSCTGSQFMVANPDTDDADYNSETGIATDDTFGHPWTAPIFLPNGAEITKATVFGGTAKVGWWRLRRVELSTGTASAVIAASSSNVENTTISNAIIDNTTYAYFFSVSDSNGSTIIGGKVNYKF